MIFAIDRAGLVGEDGPTHHGVFDISYLRIIPNIIIMSPRNESDLRNMLYTSSCSKGIFAIRYPRGSVPAAEARSGFTPIEIGKGELLLKGTKTAVLSIGNITNSVLTAADILRKKNIEITVYDMKFIKPFDTSILDEVSKNYTNIITVEENSLPGGFGSAVLEYYNSRGIINIKLNRIGIPDQFVEHGNTEILLEMLKLSPDGLAESILEFGK
jgi:1-deoxy-D-xylulose-5-phosphate synthase